MEICRNTKETNIHTCRNFSIGAESGATFLLWATDARILRGRQLRLCATKVFRGGACGYYNIEPVCEAATADAG